MQADEGFLYPLERAFFYINKPPMLLPHDDIEEIEFGRPDGNMAASTKTFDLIVRTRAPGSQVSTQRLWKHRLALPGLRPETRRLFAIKLSAGLPWIVCEHLRARANVTPQQQPNHACWELQ